MTLRIALRSLRRSPGFTLTAILTLVLGIGAVSAIFSVVNSVLLKPLSGVDTARLVRLMEKLPGSNGYSRVRTYREWRKLTGVFDSLGGRQYGNPTLTGLGDPQQLTAAMVTASWFGVHRAQPLLGRTFLPDEDTVGHENVAVLDHAFWMEHFGGNASIVGRTITLEQKPYIVVGVMPKDFLPLGKGSTDLYLPWVLDANEITGFEVTARLLPGVSVNQARAALVVVQAQLAKSNPGDYRNIDVSVEPLLETLVGPSRDLLRLLLAASALVLLVACVNIANLFLARGVSKAREMRIRAFLGASSRQLIAPALAESAIIALAGGALGLLAAWGIARMLALRLTGFPRAEDIGVDGRVALVAFGVSLLTVFGVVLFRGKTTRRALVIAEVALTFVLLISSGLLIRSFGMMRQVDLGYNPEGVILGFVSQPEDPQDQRTAAIALWRRVRERIAALPGIAAVATTTGTPAGGVNAGLPVIPEGEDVSKASASDHPNANVVIASGQYFEVAGIPVRSGRTFTDRDSINAPDVVIVSESIARRYFSGNAVGRRIQLPQFDFNVKSVDGVKLREIVGVVGDVRQKSLSETGRLTLYVPEGQGAVRYTTIVARVTNGDPMRLERALRHAVYEEAPGLSVAPMLTLETGNAYLTRAPLRAMWLLGAFAALALLLAGVGVHGVIAYATLQRTREMGIRMALGARPGQLFGMITRQALTLAIAGAGIGIIGAYAATRLLQSLLFGVTRTDFATYAAGIAILIAVAALSSFAPALRASRTDPSITLRAE